MNYLKKRILKDGQVFEGNVLKVDSFLNHQIDPMVMKEIEEELYAHYKDKGITKVLTIEASGIAPAIMMAAHLEVPMLFAKKSEPSTLSNQEKYSTLVHSYTKNVTSEVMISKQYLSKDDKVLIVDDFLANGEAALGLVDLVEQAGAKVVGVGICIEKSFQSGRQKLEERGLDVYSICRIASLENQTVTFLEDVKE
ncbi:xanthine phosphoribosyltransferase [Atopococcus tabaci]|uniref:xanthine phosphoribosyltransferase n=1 Tax=Atopococcus tabaci TaxID=269774 RepID=UPI002409289F|nr:xanthine phosphoribosyltransferase [Atopococcus tabaci]